MRMEGCVRISEKTPDSQPEEGDLNLAFENLTVGVGGVLGAGDQYDDGGSRCAPVYPDSLGNIG